MSGGIPELNFVRVTTSRSFFSKLKRFSGASQYSDDAFAVWNSSGTTPPTEIQLDISYSDTHAELDKNDTTKTVLCLHGAPGSHKDFMKLGNKLRDLGHRVIALNFPGHGFCPGHDSFKHTTFERAELVTNFVRALNFKKVDAIVGHSAGCYPITALLTSDHAGGPVFKNVIYINPAGSKPHKFFWMIRPYWVLQFFSWMWESRLGRLIALPLVFIFYKIVGIKIPDAEVGANATLTAARVGFREFPSMLETIGRTMIPRMVLFSENDNFVELELSHLYCNQLGISEEQWFMSSILNNDYSLVTQCMSESKRIAISFPNGHFIHKSNVDQVAKLVDSLMNVT